MNDDVSSMKYENSLPCACVITTDVTQRFADVTESVSLKE